MKLTADDLIQLEFVEDNDETQFECAGCGETISSWDLVPPCHPDSAFLEGSGHGGVDGMHVYCAVLDPVEGEPYGDPYCGWGGPVKEYFPQVLHNRCHKSPFMGS